MSYIVEPKENFNVIKEDPEDNVVINCAVEGRVDYIASPREFLELFERDKMKDASEEVHDAE